MKNFLEALDIKQQLKVKISLSIIDDNGYPDVKLTINNNVTFIKKDINLLNFECLIRIHQNIKIQIDMKNKIYSNLAETAVIVNSIEIDDINIIPTFNHLIEYQNDKKLPITTEYIGYNGCWTLDINEPFYNWYHKVSSQGILIKP